MRAPTEDIEKARIGALSSLLPQLTALADVPESARGEFQDLMRNVVAGTWVSDRSRKRNQALDPTGALARAARAMRTVKHAETS
jgi:hypothetical protein